LRPPIGTCPKVAGVTFAGVVVSGVKGGDTVGPRTIGGAYAPAEVGAVAAVEVDAAWSSVAETEGMFPT
jgi:hypothetical protein